MACVRGVSYSIPLYEIPSPPFQAKKGLRQEDHLSSFLFALSMEYLGRCLGELMDNLDFNFYPKCERICLTHLMFVDDLLLLSGVDLSSIAKIMVVFQTFYSALGLVASIGKSNIYIIGVDEFEVANLVTVVNLSIRELLFKYLGVSLSSKKKLFFSQCKDLIDKITERAQGWITKTLYYAGRLQLVTC